MHIRDTLGNRNIDVTFVGWKFYASFGHNVTNMARDRRASTNSHHSMEVEIPL